MYNLGYLDYADYKLVLSMVIIVFANSYNSFENVLNVCYIVCFSRCYNC